MASFATTTNAVAAMHHNRKQASAANAGTTVGTGTGYDFLLSVNNVASETFKSEDKDSFLMYWDAVFLSNTTCEDNYNAIASMSTTATGVAQAEKIQWTEIHWDFILDKANLTPTELQNRFVALNGRLGLSKDDSIGSNLPQPADGITPLADFGVRVDNLRKFIAALVRPRLNQSFIVRARALNLGYDCVTLEDYLREIRTGPYDNKKRALVYQLCNNLWGKECSMDIEKLVMKKLRLKYKNELVDGNVRVPKTRRTSGSIRKMINRMKQTNYVERFRDVCRQVWKEIPYVRELKVPQKGVIKVIKAEVATHGYEGYVGLCEGHPALLDTTAATKAEPDKRTLFDFLKQQKEDGNGSKTLDDILAVWESSNSPATTSPVTNSPRLSPPKLAAPTEARTITPPSEKAIVDVRNIPVAPPVPTPPSSPQAVLESEKPAPKAKKGPSEKKATTPKTPPPNVPKSKRPIESLAPGTKSPDRMSNGNYCYGCEHDDLVEYGRPHFNAKMCAMENYPNNCSRCERSFLPGKDKTKHCRVQGLWAVHCCRNAMNHRDHECVFALCHDCWVPKSPVKESASKRQRTSTRERKMAKQLFPGERQLKDGRVVAD